MLAWIRRVLVGIGGSLDLITRLQEVEREQERIRADLVEYQLEWENQVDKLTSMHRRANKRMQDEREKEAVQVESAQTPQLSAREARKAELRSRLKNGTSSVPR